MELELRALFGLNYNHLNHLKTKHMQTPLQELKRNCEYIEETDLNTINTENEQRTDEDWFYSGSN